MVVFRDDVLCDVKLKTDDGTVIRAHRVVLASASPYFRAMFTSCFEETNKECVDIRELDPNALRLLVDYIYTAQIKITEVNVQVNIISFISFTPSSYLESVKSTIVNLSFF